MTHSFERAGIFSISSLAFFSLVCLGLTHCASVPHLTQSVYPYFPTQKATFFDTDRWKHLHELKWRPQSTLSDDPYDALRLHSIRLGQLRIVRASSHVLPQLSTLRQSQLTYLQSQISLLQSFSTQGESFIHWLQRIQTHNQKWETAEAKKNAPAAAHKTFSPAWQSAWQEATRLWNQEDLAGASKIVDALLTPPAGAPSLPSDDYFRVVALAFRLALEQLQFDRSKLALDKLRDLSRCRPETLQAGLSLALLAYYLKKPSPALLLNPDHCALAPGGNDLSQTQFSYWERRLKNEPGLPLGDAVIFENVAPDYYALLSHYPQANIFKLHSHVPEVSTLALPAQILVSNELDELWRRAEHLLQLGLWPQASLVLTRASQILRGSGSDFNQLASTLYTAELLEGCGNFLEALRLFILANQTLNTGASLPSFATDPLFFHALLLRLFPTPYLDHVEASAHLWHVDSTFIYALMRQESAFFPLARSSADARGLLQMLPELAHDLAEAWRYRPWSDTTSQVLSTERDSIHFGVFHVYQLQTLFQHPALAAAAYNAGVRRVVNWLNKFGAVPLDVFIEWIPILETRNYIKLVLRNYWVYQALAHQGQVKFALTPWYFSKAILQNVRPLSALGTGAAGSPR